MNSEFLFRNTTGKRRISDQTSGLDWRKGVVWCRYILASVFLDMHDHLRTVLVMTKERSCKFGMPMAQVSVFVEHESTRSVTAAAIGQASKLCIQILCFGSPVCTFAAKSTLSLKRRKLFVYMTKQASRPSFLYYAGSN